MATRALSIIASDAHTPLDRANDNHPLSWTDDPRAKILLASCVANPPAGEWKRQTFGWATDRWFAYVGYRAEALDAIRMEIGTKLLAAFDADPDNAEGPFAAWCNQPTATGAIDNAIDAALTMGAL
jgi:hypothetical protein